MKEAHQKESVCVSYVLRHSAVEVGVPIDDQGYVLVEDLLPACEKAGYVIDLPMLLEIVASDKKQRYSFKEDTKYIRANQGHSIAKVKIKFEKVIPNTTVYHGTAVKNLKAIYKDGINKMSRTHVHLSEDIMTAMNVAIRHGEPVVLVLDAKRMVADGVKFFKSENDVLLVDYVDPKYINSEAGNGVITIPCTKFQKRKLTSV